MTVSWLDITLPAVTLDWCPYIPQYMYMYIYCFLGLRNCCWHSNILCVNSCVTVCNSIISGVLSKVGRDLVFINHQYTVTNCYSWLPEEREGPSHGKDKFRMIYSKQFCFYLFHAWIIYTLHYFFVAVSFVFWNYWADLAGHFLNSSFSALYALWQSVISFLSMHLESCLCAWC